MSVRSITSAAGNTVVAVGKTIGGITTLGVMGAGYVVAPISGAFVGAIDGAISGGVEGSVLWHRFCKRCWNEASAKANIVAGDFVIVD